MRNIKINEEQYEMIASLLKEDYGILSDDSQQYMDGEDDSPFTSEVMDIVREIPSLEIAEIDENGTAKLASEDVTAIVSYDDTWGSEPRLTLKEVKITLSANDSYSLDSAKLIVDRLIDYFGKK